MLFLLSFFIAFTTSTISCQSGSLYIVNEETVLPSAVSSCSSCTYLEIRSDEMVSIGANAFQGFSKLESIFFSLPDITIKKTAFQDCKSIEKLKFNNTNLYNIEADTFSNYLASFEYIGDNFDYLMYGKFLSNTVNLFTINVTNNCTIQRDDYFSISIEYLRIYANNVIFSSESFSQAKNIRISVSATESIYINEYSFDTSLINTVDLSAGKIIEMATNVFSYGTTNSRTINLRSGGIIKSKGGFFNTQTGTISLIADGDIILGDSIFRQCKSIVHISSQGSIFIGNRPFSESNSNQIALSSKGDTIIGKQNKNSITTKSLLDSNIVEELEFTCNGNLIFNYDSFTHTNVKMFRITSEKELKFETGSFITCKIGDLNIYSHSPVNFANSTFDTQTSIEKLYFVTDANITFESNSFSNALIHKLKIEEGNQYETENHQTVTFERQAFSSCSSLYDINCKTKGIIYVGERAFEYNKNLSNVYINADKKIYIRDYAFVDCHPNCYYRFQASETEISRCSRGGSCENKKSGGSSNKNDEYNPVFNAVSLGNFDIKTAYLGLSPNIVVNLNFFINIMKKARKILGHIIPPPEFVHSAIWVGESDSNKSIGAIFIYGKYYNEYNDTSYISGDGARSYVMSLKDFKDKYSVNALKLNTNKKVKLFDFIKDLKSGGKLTANEYNWPNNNCQHFTARCLNILHATRQIQNENDWIDLPKPIMKTLQLNEMDKD